MVSNIVKKIPRHCLHIMEKIASTQSEVYLVGGSVRDLILEKKSKDWDIVTSMTPERLLKLFPSGHYHGKSFGIVTVKGIEISTFRSDDGTVSSLSDDLGRRDFTFNAMALDLNGTIFDPYGGQNALVNKTISFVGNPNERIKEDPCRMLRGVRFAGLLGGELDSAAEEAIKEMKHTFNTIARERIRAELIKIMGSRYLYTALESMRKVGLLELTLPPLHRCTYIKSDEQTGMSIYEHLLTCTVQIETDNPLLRLASLLHDVGKPLTMKQSFNNYEKIGAEIVRNLLIDLKCSTFEIDYITELIKKHSFDHDATATKYVIRKFLSQLKVPIDDFLCLRYAETKALNSKQEKTNYLKMKQMIEEITRESPPLSLRDLRITGQDLKEMGLPPGPLFSKVLTACLDKVLEEPSINNNTFLRDFAKDYVHRQLDT